MKLRTLIVSPFTLVLVSAVSFSQTKPDTNIPRLEKRGTTTQLIVDGKPYLALAAELSNSSASSMEYMQPIWPRMAATNLNTHEEMSHFCAVDLSKILPLPLGPAIGPAIGSRLRRCSGLTGRAGRDKFIH
jgi:hypothetical protein